MASRLALERNAAAARRADTELGAALVVVGSPAEAQHWSELVSGAAQDHRFSPSFAVEDGRKGNLLGALQSVARLTGSDELDNIDQITMLVGTGSRLSPITQALCNIKAALPLPDGKRGAEGLTVGEAAVRAARPWIDALKRAGFDGIAVTWGDEALIPGSDLENLPPHLAKADVVRCGWRTRPDAQLASQKEWLQVSLSTGDVLRDISRQPADSLLTELIESGREPTETYVNLGSFAATREFLRLLTDVFGQRVHDEASAANWDPYFWQALQCRTSTEWDSHRHGQAELGQGLEDLLRVIPDFYGLVEEFRTVFEHVAGRLPRVAVLDFGEPYWIDAGNHTAFARAMADIFESDHKGRTIRTFLGLPERLGHGGSYVAGSSMPTDSHVANAVIIDSRFWNSETSVSRSVIVGCNIDRALIHRGVAIWTRADAANMAGPNAIVVRYSGHEFHAKQGDSLATTVVDGRPTELRYAESLGPIDRNRYTTPVCGNQVSFAEAAALMATQDPGGVHEWWRERLDHS